MIKYRVNFSGNITISSHEVIKETEKSVWYMRVGFSATIEERELKLTSYHKWCDTEKEAQKYAYMKLVNIMNSAAIKLTNAENDLKQFKQECNYD